MIIQTRTISVALTCTLGEKSTQNLNITNGIDVTIVTYLQPVTVTSNVIGQFCVTLFFGLDLVLVMIRVGVKFRL